MTPANPRILTINGGSSSIKFALFEASDSLRRILEGGIERIGLPDASLCVKGVNQADNVSHLVAASQFDQMVNHESGLLGLSETSSDMRDLLDRETQDARAAEAVALFCYQVKKWIGEFAAALGGLDTLVFAGGIGENAPTIHARICDGLGFLGIDLEAKRNAANENIISAPACRVAVRVIRTDKELIIARAVWRAGRTALAKKVPPRAPKHIGIAADREVIDFGQVQPTADDDNPDCGVSLARAVAHGGVECGSGVGACIVANKRPGVRA